MAPHVDDEHRAARRDAVEFHRLPHALAPSLGGEGPANDAIHVPRHRRRRSAGESRVSPSLPAPARGKAVGIRDVFGPRAGEDMEAE